MLSRNDTPFAAIGFLEAHRDGPLMSVTAVRASYDLVEGDLVLSDRRGVVLVDAYEGDPHRTPLLRVSDLVSFRPACDVTLVGTSYAPGGRPTASWLASIEVGRHLAALRVHGARRWHPVFSLSRAEWRLGRAEPATALDLGYRSASGGVIVGHPDGEVEPRNPIGPGLLDPDWTRPARSFAAPQIDSVEEPIHYPSSRPEPQGFGPIPPWWRQRERHAGTYDEAWRAERHPRLPADFDYRFNQCAHPRLIVPHLRGDEPVRVANCHPKGDMAFALPGIVPIAHHEWRDGRETLARLTLDGLHIDARCDPWRVDLTWRGWVARCPAYLGATLSVAGADEAAGLPRSGPDGLVEPEGAP